MKGKKLSARETRERLEVDRAFRALTFKDLLNHLRAGYSLDCFSAMSEVEIRRYIKEYPEEFIWEDLEKAMREAKIGWESIGRRQSDGSCMGNSRAWYYNMVNRYDWHEKSQVKQENTGQVSVNIVSYASTKAPPIAEDSTQP